MGVFISYSTKDDEFVDRLSTVLIQNNINIWRDKWEMKPGDSLIDKIQNGISDASFLLVVLSQNSVDSPWCKKELNAGLMRELEERQIVVIPIVIDDCKIPLLLREKVYADFRTDFMNGVQSLMRPLSKLYSDHMGRNKSGEIITDFSIDWGVRNSLYFLDLDFIVWYKIENKSILLQINATGSKELTTIHNSHTKIGENTYVNNFIINIMANDSLFHDLKIRVKGNSIFTKEIKLPNYNFDVAIRAVMMGEDNGTDVLITYGDFIDMLIQRKIN